MKPRVLRTTMALAAIAIVFSVSAPPPVFAQAVAPFYLEDNAPSGAEYSADAAKIQQLRGTGDLAALDVTCSTIEAKWSARNDPSAYFTLVQDIVEAISTVKPAKKGTTLEADKWRLVHKYAMLAVNKGNVPLDMARIFYSYLASEDLAEQQNGKLTPDQWGQTRKVRAEMWLQDWKLLASLAVPNFDYTAASKQENALRDKLTLTSTGSDEQKKGLADMVALNHQITNATRSTIFNRMYQSSASYNLAYYYSAGGSNTPELQLLLNTYGVDAASQAKILNLISK